FPVPFRNKRTHGEGSCSFINDVLGRHYRSLMPLLPAVNAKTHLVARADGSRILFRDGKLKFETLHLSNAGDNVVGREIGAQADATQSEFAAIRRPYFGL